MEAEMASISADSFKVTSHIAAAHQTILTDHSRKHRTRHFILQTSLLKPGQIQGIKAMASKEQQFVMRTTLPAKFTFALFLALQDWKANGGRSRP